MSGNSISNSDTNLLTHTKLFPTLQYKHFYLKAGNLIKNRLLFFYATCRTERLFGSGKIW